MSIQNLFVSKCFEHYYAHHQENQTVFYCIWCSALFVMDVAMRRCDASRVDTVEYSLVLLMMGIMKLETF
jgi:hypothetical protein